MINYCKNANEVLTENEKYLLSDIETIRENHGNINDKKLYM